MHETNPVGISAAILLAACAPRIIISFEQCATAGNPIAESFPRTVAAGGQAFTEDVRLAERQARASARPCLENGTLTNESSYNENTRTWLLGFEPDELKQECNPACVVTE